MARTLSDTLIIAMIESATRLAGGRGPVGASSGGASGQGGAAATPPTGEGAEGGAGGAVSTVPPATESSAPASGGSGGGAQAGGGGEHDTRTAEQIAADFKAIYTQIEEVVRSSAEQETKTVGFGQR
jgi:hypothetical protein